ncbi:hypothetical protein VspSTUT11_41510 [Vibrio sp. STUT-A11]|nr:hypothetical protein VspSTUT11_41510 [Vibrio sp. STUT-A11]
MGTMVLKELDMRMLDCCVRSHFNILSVQNMPLDKMKFADKMALHFDIYPLRQSLAMHRYITFYGWYKFA